MELTDENRAAIAAIWISVAYGTSARGMQRAAEQTFLAGKRAAEVPREPTDAMQEIARTWADNHDCNVSNLSLANLWRAMYDAAIRQATASGKTEPARYRG